MSEKIDSLFIDEKPERKVLLFGSVGAGKTTAVKTLCDSFVIDDSIESITLDSGKLNISNSGNVTFYALVSLDYPKPVWQLLEREIMGSILLIDNRRKEPLRDLEIFLSKLSSHCTSRIAAGQLVVGVTHFDRSTTPAISDFHSFIDNFDLLPDKNLPIFSVDTRSFRDMSMLLQSLLFSQDPVMDALFYREKEHS